jgi:Ca2+-binding EF-hand superfamily protein
MSFGIIKTINHKLTFTDLTVMDIKTKKPREDNEYFSLFMPVDKKENLEISRSKILYILTEFIDE